jgi:hypothetical protein
MDSTNNKLLDRRDTPKDSDIDIKEDEAKIIQGVFEIADTTVQTLITDE